MSRNSATHLSAAPADQFTAAGQQDSTAGPSGRTAPAAAASSRKSKGLVNNEFCYYCEEGGQLLNCDRCPASFHLMCHEPPLDLDQVPKGEFLCNKCRANAALHASPATTATATNEIILLERQLLALPVSHETRTVEFELFEHETSLNTLIRMAKSLNPRQMQLSKSITHECAFDLPGLSKLKWWKKEGNRIVNAKSSTTDAVAADNSLIMSRLNAAGGSTADASDPTAAPQADQAVAAPVAGVEASSSNAATANAQRPKPKSSHSTDTPRICFICQRNSEAGPMAKCGFCSLMYHLNCLNPPLCTMPPRDRLWMCPNHVEHFLDLNMLTSTRLTERLKLWQKYSLKKFDSQTVMIDFLSKCNNTRVNGLHQPEDAQRLVKHPNSVVSHPVKRCKIPATVKLMYSVQAREDADSTSGHRRSELTSKPEPIEVDEPSEDLELLAAQALEMLSQGPAAHQEPAFEVPTSSIRPPPLYKQCREAIKPRALLQYIPHRLVKAYRTHKFNHSLDSFLRKLLDNDGLSLPAPFQISYRSASIGQASNTDICLDKLLGQLAGREDARHCKFVSDKHACIYYDELTNNYELLNFSQHGTTVDNCFYGLDLDMSSSSSSSDSDSDSDQSDQRPKRSPGSADSMSSKALGGAAYNKSSSYLSARLEDKCMCEQNFYQTDIGSVTRGGQRALWEGPAILDHGSHVRIGCIDFLFIIVDYDFLLLDKTSSQRVVVSRSLPVSTIVGGNNLNRRLKSLRQQRSSPTTLVKRLRKEPDATAAASTKFRFGGKNTARLKKLRHKKSVKALSKLDKIESLIDLVNNSNKKKLLLSNNY